MVSVHSSAEKPAYKSRAETTSLRTRSQLIVRQRVRVGTRVASGKFYHLKLAIIGKLSKSPW